MKGDRDLFILLHHALPKYVERNSRLAVFLTWGFHANNFSNEIQNLEQNLANMKKDGAIGGSDQATVEEVRNFLVQAQKSSLEID